MKVGDLGCGAHGFFTLQSARAVGNKGIVYAVDVLKSALESIDSKTHLEGLANIKTVWSNLEILGATKIPEESLDRALLINVLFQVQKHQEVIKEAARLLKPEGKLLVVDWKPQAAPFSVPAEKRVPEEKVKSFTQNAGLNLEKEFEAGPYHYGLVFIK